MTTDNQKPVILETANLAKVTLNAPHKLNALTMEMVAPIGNILTCWWYDKKVKAILIKGAGDRAFCAGGDVVGVTELGKRNDPAALSFFSAEYNTNKRIGGHIKPFIAFMDGIVMGGGVGMSAHGRFRVVTERTMLAMPETTIGFFPDVGASHILYQLENNVGLYLALTGARVFAADLMHLGIATHYIHSSKLDELETALENIDYDMSDFHNGWNEAGRILDEHCGQAEGELQLPYEQIEKLFKAEMIDDIMAALKADDSEFSQKTQKTLAKLSPTSLRVTCRQFIRCHEMNMWLENCLTLDYYIAQSMLLNKDFYEGVRALLVDKDKNPQWQPDISEEEAEAYLDYREPIEKRSIYFYRHQPVETESQRIIDNKQNLAEYLENQNWKLS